MLLNDVNDIFVNCHMFCNSHCWGTISYGASDRLASLVTRGYIRKIRSIHGGILTRKFAASSSSSHLPKYFVVNSAEIVTNSAEIRECYFEIPEFPPEGIATGQLITQLISWLPELSQLIVRALSADFLQYWIGLNSHQILFYIEYQVFWWTFLHNKTIFRWSGLIFKTIQFKKLS